MRRLRAFGCALALALAGCATVAADGQPPVHSQVSDVLPGAITFLEPRIIMPPGSQPLLAYDRYYAVERVSDRDIVHGVLLLRSAFGDVNRAGMSPLPDRPHVYHGAPGDLPVVADGGCAVVTLFFDPLTFQFLQIEQGEGGHITRPAVCNGVA